MRATPVIFCLALVAVGGFGAMAFRELGGAKRLHRWRQESVAAEALELWSIEAVGAAARPVPICTSWAMRLGFVRPSPAVGNLPCLMLETPVEVPGRYAFRCQLGDQEWAVTSLWRGDRAKDFTDSVFISSLDAPFRTYAVQRRYRRLGACPPGWTAGDSLDQQGRRANALQPWPKEASPPP